MTDLLQELLSAGAIPATAYPPTSRYAGTEVRTHDPGDGTPPVPYLGRRLVPSPERFATVREVRVIGGDRRDLLAERHLGDAQLWWRLADANGVLDPRQLTDTVGARLRVTLAEGIPGGDDD
jgi:hypothetical protein